MGHATRCVPIIYELLKNDNRVILGVTSLTAKVLDREFPQLEKIALPEYAISYSKILPIWLKLLFSYPRLRSVIKKENQLLASIVSEKKIDVVVSDNRYGLYHQRTQNIIVCHQINLINPFAGIANRINTKWLKLFNEVWVPDFEDRENSLAGDLSINAFNLSCKYIGPLSRLKKCDPKIEYDILFLLSGPEPQHSQLLGKALSYAEKNKGSKIAVVTSLSFQEKSNAMVFSNPDPTELSKIISSSKIVVCRSGYSTLMDMYYLGKSDLILVPTTGQSEQEYLAHYWNTKFKTVILSEVNFNNLRNIIPHG